MKKGQCASTGVLVRVSIVAMYGLGLPIAVYLVT